MEQFISELNFDTNGEGFINITATIKEWIYKNRINKGILILFLKHTSCSLIINENADPKVLKDLSSYMKAIAPEEGFYSINGDKNKQKYLHSEEGLDDMPAHIKTMLTCSTLSLSIDKGELALGTWQAVYLWEHRYSRNTRKLQIHAVGDIL